MSNKEEVESMYLDPGFGGMIIQVIVALVAVGGAIIFSICKKTSVLFKKGKAKREIVNLTAHEVISEDGAIDMLADEEEKG
jgi:hypothetical protein